MASEDSVNSTVQQAVDQGRNIADKASETVKDGYKAAQQYAQDNLSVDSPISCGVNLGWLLRPRLRSVMLQRK